MVSCIVTTYKRPIAVLKRALDSIVNQTYKDTEIIVVNDAPEDKATDEEIQRLLKSYDRHVQYILSPTHLGACMARNYGLAQAKGEYVAFLDDDDEWLPRKLEKQMQCMQKTNVALVYCSHYVVDKAGRKRHIEEPLAREGVHLEEFRRLLQCNFIGSTSYPLLKTSVVRAVGGFAKDLPSSQDHDLWLKIAREYRIYYDKEPLVILYYSKDAISRKREKVLKGYEYLLNKYATFYEKDKKLYNYRLNYLAVCCASQGFWKEFLNYFWRAVRVKTLSLHNFMILRKACRKLGCLLSNGE